MPRTLSRTIPIALVLLAAAAGGWIYFNRDARAQAPEIATATVTRGDVAQTVLATGLIEAEDLVSVGARTSGLIEELTVEVGDDVAQGEVIARIDNLEQQNAVAQAKADLAQIEADIASKTAEIQQAELELTRQEGLNARQITSNAELESARATLTMAQAALESLAAQKSRAEIEVSTAELDLSRTEIRAPIDGTVVAVVSGEGTTVNASNETPTIVKLAQLDRMEVKAEISEADVVNVHAGQPVSFALIGAPEVQYDAELAKVEPAPSSIGADDEVDTDSAIYYNARFTVDNPDRVLRIGMSADVTIILGQAQDVVLLPLSALPSPGPDGRRVVEVLTADGSRDRREIATGLRDSVHVEITSGLSEGDRVVLAATAPRSSGGGRMGGGRGPRLF